MVMPAAQHLTRGVRLRAGAIRPASPRAHKDEYSAKFDRCRIIYSDRMNCGDSQLGQISRITSLMLGHTTGSQPDEYSKVGETTIGCYQGDRFVGSVNFYSNLQGHPPSNVDPEGRVHLWFPLPCFPRILCILGGANSLSLTLIYSDLNGKSVAQPAGALLTWPEPTGKEDSADC